jgi:hypothetical protein
LRRTGKDDQRRVNGSLKFLSKLWSSAQITTPRSMSHQRSEIHELTRSKIPQKKSRAHLKATAKQRKQTPKVISKKDLCAVPDCPDPGDGLSVVQSSDCLGHLAGLSGGTRLTTTVNGGLSGSQGADCPQFKSRKTNCEEVVLDLAPR